MEPGIKKRFNQPLLEQALARYGVKPDQVHSLDGFESFIYEFRRGSEAYILRIGHTLRRSERLIQGEVDWINYLFRGGVSVSRAIRSREGRLVEAVPDGHGQQFLATAFVKAPGAPPANGLWEDTLVERYGRLLGRMHALSQTYEPTDPTWRRPDWDDPVMIDMAGWLPQSEAAVLNHYVQLKHILDGLPKDRHSFGLIHQDAHAGNFYVDDSGQITLFDFDDCVYSWYANDIAIVLFYAVLFQSEPAAFSGRFLQAFLKGYYAENRLDPAWLAQIPHFLKLREIDLYAVIHRSFDVDNLEDPWVLGFMDGRKKRIERGLPFLDFDFAALADEHGTLLT